MSITTVLSGAGLSVVSPSHAPLGDELRDAYIAAILESAPDAPWESIADLRKDALWQDGLGRWRLETVVGMVHALVGDRGFAPLVNVLRGSPNRAHELAARLLRSGNAPVHLTFNFDDFVERAYEGLAGEMPEVVTPDDTDRIDALMDADWHSIDPIVVHLHGRVVAAGDRCEFPGLVVTLEAIQRGSPPWLEPLLKRALTEEFVATGYSGLDTDVWPALLKVANEIPARRRIWNTHRVACIPPRVLEALGPLGFEFTGGGSGAALSEALGTPEEVSNDRGAFDPKVVATLLQLSRGEGTLILAWMLEDVGGRGRDVALCMLGDAPPEGTPEDVAWRWFWKLGTIRRDRGQHVDALPYLRVARAKAPGNARTVRASLRLDEAEAYRHLLRSAGLWAKLSALINLQRSLLLAQLAVRRGEGDEFIDQRIRRIRAHVLLRVLDTGPALPPAVRRVLALRARTHLQRAVGGGSPHETAFAHLQLAEAISYAALAGGRKDPDVARAAVTEAVARADFIAQPLLQGNALCASALVEMAFGDSDEAEDLLRRALDVYNKADHQSGRDLVTARRGLSARIRP